MSAEAPGSQQPPTVHAAEQAANRRRPLFAAAVVAGLVVVAAGIWLLTRADEPRQGDAISAAVSGPASPAATGAPTSTTPGSAGGSSPTATAGGPTTAPGSPSSVDLPTIDRTALTAVLISEDDVDGAITLETDGVTSGRDANHPLVDYHYCNQPLDLSQAGPSAKRVLNTNLLSADSLVASTVTVMASAEAAQAVIDQMVASAGSCTTYTDNSATFPAQVRILGARTTADGAEITEQITTAGTSVDLTITTTRVGDIITTLEVTPVTREPARLQQLLTSRAAALPR